MVVVGENLTLRGTAHRIVSLFCLLVAASVGSCTSNYQCTGSRILCEDLTADGCSSVPGCTAGPACMVYENDVSCATFRAAAACSAPKCRWTGACVNVCSTLQDALTCNTTYSPIETTPGTRPWGCLWVQCTGTPLKPFCSDYSNTECPANRGCSVEKVSAF